MNIAITFTSDDYRSLVGEVLADCSEDRTVDDPDAFTRASETFRDLTLRIAEVLDEIYYLDAQALEECVTGDDPYDRFVARMILKFKTIYPGADIISLSPINLKGNLVVVFHVPDGSVLNLNAIR